MNEQTKDEIEELESLILDTLEEEGIDHGASGSFYRLEAMYFSALRCDAAVEIMRKRARWVIKTEEWDEKEVALYMDLVSDSLWRIADLVRKAMTHLHDEMNKDIKRNASVAFHMNHTNDGSDR